jgi:thiol:disulfide interchange protein DsbC
MRIRHVSLLQVLLVLVGATSAIAAVPTAPAPDSAAMTTIEATIKKTIESRFAGHPVESVLPSTTLPGWYDVVAGTEIVYSDATADHIIVGKVIDTRTKEDLTSKRWDQLHSIDFASLPISAAIKTVRGNGQRKVAIFADPNCPYCQQLEHNIASVSDVTIYTFLYPLEDLHPGATAKAHQIWCAPNSSDAWSNWMLKRQEPAASAASCTTDPIFSNAQLGKKLDISMTPTIFFSDGHRVAGVMSAEEFEGQLNYSTQVAQR